MICNLDKLNLFDLKISKHQIWVLLSVAWLLVHFASLILFLFPLPFAGASRHYLTHYCHQLSSQWDNTALIKCQQECVSHCLLEIYTYLASQLCISVQSNAIQRNSPATYSTFKKHKKARFAKSFLEVLTQLCLLLRSYSVVVFALECSYIEICF